MLKNGLHDILNINMLGFTIAEVLIVLGIIGIIAELTIPTLMQNVQEKVAIVGVKKAYSVLSNAYIMAVSEKGDPDSWNLMAFGSHEGAVNMLNSIVPYLIITKSCVNSGDCWPSGYKYLNGSDAPYDYNTGQFASLVLNDGSLLSADVHSSSCSANYSVSDTGPLKSVCGTFNYDINGVKKPNKIGIDVFGFWLTLSGIIPFGVKDDSGVQSTSFEHSCYNYGQGCTGWVIYNENMDYLHCNDLSWTGKRKCG